MLKDFDGNTFRLHGIMPSFLIKLGSKIVSIKVVVNVLLDYNIFLGCSWSCAMESMVSLVYRVIKFPHKGRIMTIYHLSLCHRNVAQLGPNIPMVDNSTKV